MEEIDLKIFLYNPDDGISYNYIPHLWMFLLKALTPENHEVIIADRKVQNMNEKEISEYVVENGIGLVGIGAMTRMIGKAYKVADAVRERGISVVMGGPHVTVMPEEALKHADSVAIGEADNTWPQMVEDAKNGNLKKIYRNAGKNGKEEKPDLGSYPLIPWSELDIGGFNNIPKILRPMIKHFAKGWENFFLIPVETQRGCPYGCEFCTVTRFFGNSIRFRTNESVVQELLNLKSIVKEGRGRVGVLFVDDNFAINLKRTKSLLRDIIAANAQIFYFAQISINLLKDDELIDLLAESGCKWIFIGLESIDETNLKLVHKNQNKPKDYKRILEKLAQKDIYAIVSFIFGFDNDSPGIAERTFQQLKTWPPCLPVFGQLTPYPGTPLYDKLLFENRLERPVHWIEVQPFEMAHHPLRISPEIVHQELKKAWTFSYSSEMNYKSINCLSDRDIGYQLFHLIARVIFHGIYFPQKSSFKWIKVLFKNRKAFFKVGKSIYRKRIHSSKVSNGVRP